MLTWHKYTGSVLLHTLAPPTLPCPAHPSSHSPVSDEGVVVTAAGLPAVHHNATQSVLSALQTLLQLGTVGITVLLNHLTWREGGEGSGCEGRGGGGTIVQKGMLR